MSEALKSPEIEDMEIVRKAKHYALQCHQDKYHPHFDTPHMDHLNQTASVALRHLKLIRETDKSNILAACYLHDLMQYCGKTFPEISKEFNEEIAEMVFLNTPLRGRNRKDTQNSQYFEELRQNHNALFIRLCSRIASAETAKEGNRSIFAVYYATKTEFMNQAHKEQFIPLLRYYQSLFEDLDKI